MYAQQRRPGYEVLPVVAENSWLAARLAQREMPYKTAPFIRGIKAIFDNRTRKTLEEIIADFNPDVIQNWAGHWSRHLPRTRQPQVARMGIPMPPRYVKKSDYIVGPTRDVCTFLEQKGQPKEKLRHIPALVNIPPKGYEDFRYDVRSEYNIPHDAHLLLLLGRLHEAKGFDVALFALNMLPESVHILIVGEGPEYGALKDAVAADDIGHRVHFAGWIDNTSPIFAAADSFLLPSRRQSSCNVVLEAWAHKLPVVATNIPAARALVDHGQTGLLIPPEDEVAMAEAVNEILEDDKLRTRLAKAGAEKVQQVFAEDEILNAYDALYRDAIVAKKRRPQKNER